MPPHRWHRLRGFTLGSWEDILRPMLERWLARILSIVQPLSWADCTGSASRRQLVQWAETLEAVAKEMRAKAGVPKGP